MPHFHDGTVMCWQNDVIRYVHEREVPLMSCTGTILLMLDACGSLHTADDIASILPIWDSFSWLPVHGKALKTSEKNMKIQLGIPRSFSCHSHGIGSETKIFRTKERNKRNLTTPVWKVNWASPNPNQFFMSIQCFHDTSALPCAEVNDLYHEVGEFMVNSLFSISQEGWMCNLAYILGLRQLIFMFLREPARESWQLPWTCLFCTLTQTGITPWYVPYFWDPKLHGQ